MPEGKNPGKHVLRNRHPLQRVDMPRSLVEQYRRWFEYEKDSHRKVLASLETVPEEGRESAPFHKALDLMGHLFAARRMWLFRIGFIPERPAEIFPTGVSMDDLRRDLVLMERPWEDYLRDLNEDGLDRVLEYRTSEGDRFRSVVEDILAQVHGHSLYHRGQIASLVKAAGGEPAKTDFIFWSREASTPPT
jgi:uncharacterized damage-inducible protein DinB